MYKNVDIIDVTNIRREFFTRHGMHLNGQGKDYLAKLVAFKLKRLLGRGNENETVQEEAARERECEHQQGTQGRQTTVSSAVKQASENKILQERTNSTEHKEGQHSLISEITTSEN